MLGQVLGWGLLGCPCTVEQLPLQKRQVGLETEKRRMRLFFRRMAGLRRRDTEVLKLFPAHDDKVLTWFLISNVIIDLKYVF